MPGAQVRDLLLVESVVPHGAFVVHGATDGGDGGASRRSCLPSLPVCQRVISFPKRLRDFLQGDAVLRSAALREEMSQEDPSRGRPPVGPQPD
jgi:hypothetical protein